MAFRACIYKKCGNYTNLRDRSFNDVKLFGFPRNPERRKKWIELGEVPPNVPESMYFFCSDHFDKKFLAINNRRTVLVGEAVPFPYVDTEIAESNREEEADINYVMYDMSRSDSAGKQDYTSDQDIVVESTTNANNIVPDDLDVQQFDDSMHKEQPEEYIIFSDDECNKEESFTFNMNKRKAENVLMQATSSKPKIIKTTQVQKSLQNPIDADNAMKSASNANPEDFMNSHDVVDSKHVTTFIFKGEEYVQMPKNYYVMEKIELMKKMQKMEHALQEIKGLLSPLDI